MNQNGANGDERTMPAKHHMFILQMISNFAKEGYLK